jgi:hypothetical protein
MANLEMFSTLVQHSTKVLCMDAFISNRTLDTLRLMKRPFKYFDFVNPLVSRTCRQELDEVALLSSMLQDLAHTVRSCTFSAPRLTSLKSSLPLKLENDFQTRL